MDKNSLLEPKQIWKGHLAIFTLVSLIIGMMCARFLASVSTIALGAVALYNIHPRHWLRQRWWLFGLIWVVIYALSAFWSADTEEWFSHLQVKFPFLFLPLAFAFLPPFTPKQLRAFTWCLLALMCIGSLYSLSFLWRTPDLVHAYKYAHVIPTPVYNDHIAFSSMVALTIAWSVYYRPFLPKGWQQWLLIALAVFLSLYLHVLAAKTGLIALYIFMLGLVIYTIKKSPGRGLIMLAVIAAGVAAAFTLLPTLRERAGYSMVTWRSYIMGERSGIYSDMGRIFSYDIAMKSIAAHPIIGVGAGDVMPEMRAGYAKWYPEVPAEAQLWPHNQFLTCAMAVGIPAAIFFTLWLIAPLRLVKRNRSGFYFVLIWLMLLVPLMVDVFLEVQFGVAVFLIFLLWQRQTLVHPVSAPAQE